MEVRAGIDDARVKDITLAVAMIVLALVMTLPATLYAIGFAYRSSTVTQWLYPCLLMSALNGYVFGYPAMVLLRRWHHRIRHDKSGHTWMWGHYWRLQFQMLAPLLKGGLLLFGITFIPWLLGIIK